MLELMYGRRHVLARRLGSGHLGRILGIAETRNVSERRERDDLIRPNVFPPGSLETFTLERALRHAGESPLSQQPRPASYDSEAKKSPLDGSFCSLALIPELKRVKSSQAKSSHSLDVHACIYYAFAPG